VGVGGGGGGGGGGGWGGERGRGRGDGETEKGGGGRDMDFLSKEKVDHTTSVFRKNGGPKKGTRGQEKTKDLLETATVTKKPTRNKTGRTNALA